VLDTKGFRYRVSSLSISDFGMPISDLKIKRQGIENLGIEELEN
jgi:hypothetical protein